MATQKVVFAARSFGELQNLNVGEVRLKPGGELLIELQLNLPIGRHFDLFDAERPFRDRMPPGLKLKDVYSPDSSIAIIRCEAVAVETQTRPGVQALPLVLGPTIASITAFLGLNWLRISLIAIGITLLLGALVKAITGKALLEHLTGILLGDLGPLVLIGGLVLTGLYLWGKRNQ